MSAPGTADAVTSRVPTVDLVVDGDTATVVLDVNHVDIWTQVIRTLSSDTGLRTRLIQATLPAGNGILKAHTAHQLAQAMGTAVQVTLTQDDAEKVSTALWDAAQPVDDCGRDDCPNLATDGGLCAGHHDRATVVQLRGA